YATRTGAGRPASGRPFGSLRSRLSGLLAGHGAPRLFRTSTNGDYVAAHPGETHSTFTAHRAANIRVLRGADYGVPREEPRRSPPDGGGSRRAIGDRRDI